ncbi:MAG: ABC transporter permease [Verrucomicrobia bacterium]|nr:ABC transporter permease [Verrucomicrobiota bacterium]
MRSDLRFAFRQLVKAPGFTIIAIVALALGIATATTNFTFYNALLVRPLPFIADEDRLLNIRTYNLKLPKDDFENSVPDFQDIRRTVTTLDNSLTLWNRTYILAGTERPDRVLGCWITADGFQTLGVRPALGRLFRLDESKPGAEPVALLSHGLWQRAFGGNADIVGQTVKLNNESVTVVGVMPAGFGFPENSQLWQPFPDHEPQQKEDMRGSHGWPVFARMKPGATIQQVQAELDTLAARLERDYPKTNSGMRFRALTVREQATREERLTLQLMLGATLAVLLIACGNVANLLLARAAGRSREIAIRAALGAGRGRIIRQMLTESLMLAAAGGVCGWLLTYWETDFILGFIPVEIPFWIRFEPDWRVFAFAAAATLASSVLFGLFPALQAARTELAVELKDGARGGTGSGRSHRLRSGLVVAQLALTLVLLVVAGLMMRSFLHLQHTRTGFDPRGVFTFRTGIPPTIEKDEQVALRFFETAEQRLREIPGVESAGFLSYLPLSNNTNYGSFVIEGRPEPQPGDRPHALARAASPGVFPTLRIPLLRGRLLDARDRVDAPWVILISDTFAKKIFPNEDPLGRRLSFDHEAEGGKRKWFTIVGLVGDVTQRPTQREREPAVWVSSAQRPDNFMSAVMRVPGDPASYQRAAQDAVLAARADIPIYYAMPMTKVASDAMWSQRFFSGLFTSFAGIALFLAAIGIYGVMACSVSQRTQEIGVRMALGAQPGAVVAMILRQGLRLVGLGLALGFVGAWFAAQLLTTVLYGISPHDPPTFALVPLLLALVALAACYLPSRRATLIDPITALRAE